eukprot:964194-Prorocentrum_minimum.AAC.1
MRGAGGSCWAIRRRAKRTIGRSGRGGRPRSSGGLRGRPRASRRGNTPRNIHATSPCNIHLAWLRSIPPPRGPYGPLSFGRRLLWADPAWD